MPEDVVPEEAEARLRSRSERVVGVVVVVAAAVYVLTQLQFDLLFKDTTINGGDTGAHVWWPAYMRDHVFPKLALSGWAPDWYAGFPVGHFYFPVPALLIVGLDLVLPYNVAFKLVTVLGPLLLPAAAYALARGLKAPWPAPPLFAAATLPFLFLTPGEHNFNIMGGNLPSTLAGEFSYTIALALALFFLAALARALDEGTGLWLPALLLGLTVLTHGIVTVFAAVGGVVVWLARGPVRRFRLAAAVALVGFLLTAVWSVPAVGRVGYMTDMGWAKVTEYRTYLLHDGMRPVIVLAGVALVAGAAYLRRATLELAALAGAFALLFRYMPEARLWNLRVLPFYLLVLFLLAAMGVAEVVNLVRRGLESERTAALVRRGPSGPIERGGKGGEGGFARAGVVLGHGAALFALVAMLAYVNQQHVRDFIPGWAKWNYSGYEAKDAFPEYQEVMDTLDGLRVPYGRRLLWERLNKINDYGSDLSLELIPHFTEGKVGSMEGLYFESAGTTPYHFLTVAELANEPSNPVRGLEYGNIHEDFDRGVEHLAMLGVRFYLAGSDVAKGKASGHPGLRLVTEIGDPKEPPKVARWALYEVLGADLVEPMAYQPVVLDDVKPHDWRKAHGEGPSVEWFKDPSLWDRHWAGDGPEEWERAHAAEAEDAPLGRRLPRVEVSGVELGDDHVRFRVDRTGVPVLVKVSYFPNWQVKGARGPWRVTPNFMVVVPTGHEVELRYGRTPLDRAAIVLTLLGMVGLVALARRRPEASSRFLASWPTRVGQEAKNRGEGVEP